jgi:hypothetical protein
MKDPVPYISSTSHYSSLSKTLVTPGYLLLVFVDFTGPTNFVVFGLAVGGFGAAVITVFAVSSERWERRLGCWTVACYEGNDIDAFTDR